VIDGATRLLGARFGTDVASRATSPANCKMAKVEIITAK
jgi:hypothetical protein